MDMGGGGGGWEIGEDDEEVVVGGRSAGASSESSQPHPFLPDGEKLLSRLPPTYFPTASPSFCLPVH